MKEGFILRPYQEDAAGRCIENLQKAKTLWKRHHQTSWFALSAITGSGKTVIATAVIEAIIHGSSKFPEIGNSNTTFLWVTDSPTLNRQTRDKMTTVSNGLSELQMAELNDEFREPRLKPGWVYFLNIQQLTESSNFGSRSDKRDHSGWDVLRNTIEDDSIDFYVVIDEAHKGMKTKSSERSTIVQQIIGGRTGVEDANPAAPVVWGISATIGRFSDAMAANDGRIALGEVKVPIDEIRKSGLVKDEIGLVQPIERQQVSTTLLSRAVADAREYERKWRDYCNAIGEEPVLPVLVVQVPDKAERDGRLVEIVDQLEDEWSELAQGSESIVHVFGEDNITLGSRAIPHMRPECIQGDDKVRVVLAKTAISTGWDCPRAEVLYSERPARDATHIAQVIGRIIRQPLADRVEDGFLNSVRCYLPKFDRGTVGRVVKELEGSGMDSDSQAASKVVLNPATFGRNPKIPGEILEAAIAAVERIVSLPAPRSASQIRRAEKLQHLLTELPTIDKKAHDADNGRTENARRTLRSHVLMKLDELTQLDRNKQSIDREVVHLKESTFATVTVAVAGGQVTNTEEKQSIDLGDADSKAERLLLDLDEADNKAERLLNCVPGGFGSDYFKYLADKIEAEDRNVDPREVRIRAAALFQIEITDGSGSKDVNDVIEKTAADWVAEQLESHDIDLKHAAQAKPELAEKLSRIKEEDPEPREQQLSLPDSIIKATERRSKASKGGIEKLPLVEKHLFSDAEGKFPVNLNALETKVLAREIDHQSCVAWYRNPDHAGEDALSIAYVNDDKKWSSLHPDFIVVSDVGGKLVASIIDPHSRHLSDNDNKLSGLAAYAEEYGDDFGRIESGPEKEEKDGRLEHDLKDAKTRELWLGSEEDRKRKQKAEEERKRKAEKARLDLLTALDNPRAREGGYVWVDLWSDEEFGLFGKLQTQIVRGDSSISKATVVVDDADHRQYRMADGLLDLMVKLLEGANSDAGDEVRKV